MIISSTTSTIFRITFIIYIEPVIRIGKESFGWRTMWRIRILYSLRSVRRRLRLVQEIRVQNNARPLLWCKLCLRLTAWKHAAWDRSMRRIFWPVKGVEDWGDRITVARISVVHGTERVSCTLSGEGCLVWASENGPIAWRGIWKYRLGITLRAWRSISAHPSDIWQRLRVDKLAAGIALPGSWRLLTNGWPVLYEARSFRVLPSDFSRTSSCRAGAWPTNKLPLQNSKKEQELLAKRD